MLQKLKKQMYGKYPMGCAKELEDIENAFLFQKFNSEDALSLGKMFVQRARKYNEDVIILIIREEDQIPIFQYIGDTRTQRNVEYALKKRNTVLKTGHCSLWAMAQELTEGGLDEIFDDSNDCLPVGGAFPVYVDEKLVATICVSGLHNGKDHELIVETLAEYLDIENLKFRGTLI